MNNDGFSMKYEHISENILATTIGAQFYKSFIYSNNSVKYMH